MTPKTLLTLKRSTPAYINFTKVLLKKNVSKSNSERESFLNSVALPNFNSKSFDIWESEIIKKDLTAELKSMPNGKSRGHDGLNKEFCKLFWNYLGLFY